MASWSRNSGFSSAAEWMHENKDRYYKQRRVVYEAALERAKELAALSYPKDLKKFSKTDKYGKELKSYVRTGEKKKRTQRLDIKKGEGLTESVFRMANALRDQILSGLIAKHGANITKKDVMSAGDTKGRKMHRTRFTKHKIRKNI